MSETKNSTPIDIPAVDAAPTDDASSRASSPGVPEEPTRMVLPSSSPPQTTSSTAASSTTTEAIQTTHRGSPVDPRVVELRAMFPDYDDTILQSVLASVNYNQDLAVEALLTMSDPEYKPEPATRTQPDPVAPLTQEQLDEEFARQLLIQDQHQHSQWAASHVQSGPGAPPGTWGPPGAPPPMGWQGPYQQQPPSQGQGQGQGMTEFQEQLSKFAESGKKTFGSIVSKVKAKLQEFEQGKTAPSTLYIQQQQQQPQWTAGPASYYGPPQSSSYPTYTSPSSSSTQRLSSRPNSTSPTSTLPPTLPQNKPVPSPPSQPPPVNRAASPTAAQPIDGGKLGLLPKRPVSLIRDNNAAAAPASSTAAAEDGKQPTEEKPVKGYVVDDDDDLEYAENPFEDTSERKK